MLVADQHARNGRKVDTKGKGRILIVEDSPTQALELTEILESAGLEAVNAPNGEAGFEVFKSSDFDVVISDIIMPGMSGYDLCRRIKAHPIKGNVPVILLTSLTDPMDIIQALESGANNYVTKPYKAPNLLARITCILANRALRTEVKVKLGTEVIFMGKKLTINSDKEQILELLIATFEDIVRTNRELQQNQAELAAAKVKVDHYARQLEGKVRYSEDKYKRLMEQANDAIFVLDSSGRIQEVNRSAEDMLGQPASDIIGSYFKKWVPAVEFAFQKSHFQKLLAEGFVRGSNVSIPRRDGQQVCVDYAVSPAEVDGECAILAILHDVTERNRLERQLQQAQKMEAIGRLAGGVAHDFNNLLTIISGYSEMLLSDRVPTDSSRELIGEIHKAGDRAAGLTRQLLAFSRQQVLAPKVLDLNSTVSDTEKMLRRLIGEDVRLISVLEPKLGRVKADPGQIEQVILNLAVNARDAMPRGGKFTIETENIDFDETCTRLHPEVKPGHYVRLAVSDTGCGMDEATKARIFEPFFTTKEAGKGTGLGLATVYGIVKQSGGYVYVRSEPDAGTRFSIYLPLVEGGLSLDKPEHDAAGVPTGTETILLVEDEDAVRALARIILQNYGYTVLEASHGKDAIRICNECTTTIHLLVSDVVMPGIGGQQLVENLVQRQPEMKVLYLSGYTNDAVVRHGVVEGEVNFLQKPFSPVALAQKVRAVLDQNNLGLASRNTPTTAPAFP